MNPIIPKTDDRGGQQALIHNARFVELWLAKSNYNRDSRLTLRRQGESARQSSCA